MRYLIKIIFILVWQNAAFFSFAADCDFSNHDMDGESATSYTICANKCKNTLGCTHFGWHPNWCLKKSMIVSQNDAYAHTVVKICGILHSQVVPGKKTMLTNVL